MCVLRFKDGVLPIGHLAPAGVRILGALERIARLQLLHDLTITCADKEHPAADPHASGEAFDVRTHDLATDQKQDLLIMLMNELSDGGDVDPIVAKDGGWVTRHFFSWLENAGTDTEHLHVQRRNSTTYP